MYKVLARRDEKSKWIVKRVAVFSKANASEISARFEKEGFETCIKEYGTEQKSKKKERRRRCKDDGRGKKGTGRNQRVQWRDYRHFERGQQEIGGDCERFAEKEYGTH